MGEPAHGSLVGRWQASLGQSLAGLDPDRTHRPSQAELASLAPTGSSDSEATLYPSQGASTQPSPSGPGSSGPTLPSSPGQPGQARELVARGGAYQLLNELGRGGMGVVYRARQPGLGREVALKQNLGSGESARAAFLAEAHVTSRLEHPNIVPVYALLETEAGESALAMKWVRGTSWKEVLATPGRDLDFHLSVLLAVANAVAFAHSRGVVHCDLKPENVMVGEFGEVLVMDWGLAVDVRPQPDPASPVRHRSQLTHPCGSPSYIPPELALGEGHRVGPWTDTYLLGSILYELLSGSPPHRRATFEEALASAASGEIPTLPPEVPAALRALCTKALAPEPEARFGSATELRQALQDYLKSRESLTLSEQARALLERARAARDEAPEGRSQVYAQLTEAGAGFRQALLLWPGNAQAQEGAEQASTTLVEGALAHGDLGLASSELQRLAGPPAAHLGERVAQARAERQRAQRASERLQRVVVALLAAVLTLLTGGLLMVRKEQRRAEQAALLADGRLVEVNRLSDVKRLAEERELAERLWPAREANAPAMERWLAEARALLERLPLHRATLAELRAQAQALPDAGWAFGADEVRWQHDTLAELITGLGRFGAEEVPAMERRLALAKSLRAQSLEAHRAEWERASAAIAASPHYGGLRLAPQLGLVPLGPDPASGLWEFAHLESGAVPARGPDGALQLDEGTGVVLVLLPGGSFSMGVEPPGPGRPPGSPNTDPQARPAEGPVHRVELAPFFLSKYELTQGQWLRATGSNPSAYQAGQTVGDKRLTLRNPVEQVGWADCQRVLGHWELTLPTEAQWEYGARAGTTTPWWEGQRIADLQGAANLADRYCKAHGGPASWVYEDALDDGWVTHAPVGLLRANPFGLHDMQGNVWEWCQDRYGPYTLPVAPGTGERLAPADAPRVFRGGGFRSSSVHARSGDRYSLYYNGSKAFDVGVRPARPLEPAAP